MFKEHQDSLPEIICSIGFPTFHDIVKLPRMLVESKYVLSAYYIKFSHGKNIFDHMLDRIGQIYINYSSSIPIIGLRKTLNKEWHNQYEFLTWEYEKNHLKQSDMDQFQFCTFVLGGNC